jgi:hypothetical protein
VITSPVPRAGRFCRVGDIRSVARREGRDLPGQPRRHTDGRRAVLEVSAGPKRRALLFAVVA